MKGSKVFAKSDSSDEEKRENRWKKDLPQSKFRQSYNEKWSRDAAKRIFNVVKNQPNEKSARELLKSLKTSSADDEQKSAIDNFLHNIDINEYSIDRKEEKEEEILEKLILAIEEAERKNNSKKGLGMLDSILDYLLEKLQQQWHTLFYALVPLHQVQTLVLICFVQLIGLNFV
uniref:Uncharacterized protein n=1 Tax=Meloidogyne hapla TaxID=6305 RepID=A0A1I8B3N7_MELHA